MAVRTIDLYTRSSLGPFLEGSEVRVTTLLNVMETEGVTDVSGKFGPIMLEDGSYYTIAKKSGYIFPVPYLLIVSADGSFDLSGVPSANPTATSVRRCRIYGTLIHPDGSVARRATITFKPVSFSRASIDGKAVVGDARARTSSDGVLDVELLRDTKYLVTTPWDNSTLQWSGQGGDLSESEHFTGRLLYVPNQSSLGVSDFLNPVPSWVKTSSSTISVAVGAEGSVDSSVVWSNGEELEDMASDVLSYSLSSPIAELSVTNGKISVKGLSSGTATLVAERVETIQVDVPTPSLTVGPLTVTVT